MVWSGLRPRGWSRAGGTLPPFSNPGAGCTGQHRCVFGLYRSGHPRVVQEGLEWGGVGLPASGDGRVAPPPTTAEKKENHFGANGKFDLKVGAPGNLGRHGLVEGVLKCPPARLGGSTPRKLYNSQKMCLRNRFCPLLLTQRFLSLPGVPKFPPFQLTFCL